MKLLNVKEAKVSNNLNRWESYTDQQLKRAYESAMVSKNKSNKRVLASLKKELDRRWKQGKLNEKEDLSALPEDTIKTVQKNIRDGAKDTTQLWANALELVHKAYEVSGVQRPDLTMQAAWKQYEENIGYATKELANARGIDGDWRMSSVFREAEDARDEYSVQSDVDGLPINVLTKADSVDELIQPFYDHNVTGCDIELKHRSPTHVCLYFCKDGKRTGDKVTIKRMSKKK